MAGTRLRTLSRLTPKLHALGPTPVATPTRAWRRCGSRLSHCSPRALVRSPALKEEAVRGWGGFTELRGLLTKGSHRSVKSFCTSLQWEILSSCPGQPEPWARGSLLNTVNFHLGHGSPMQGGPGACYYDSSGSGLPELLARKKSLPPNGPRPTPRTPTSDPRQVSRDPGRPGAALTRSLPDLQRYSQSGPNAVGAPGHRSAFQGLASLLPPGTWPSRHGNPPPLRPSWGPPGLQVQSPTLGRPHPVP